MSELLFKLETLNKNKTVMQMKGKTTSTKLTDEQKDNLVANVINAIRALEAMAGSKSTYKELVYEKNGVKIQLEVTDINKASGLFNNKKG